uniref:Uncharacterized protein n=1 Tax=Sphaerodactylus townsendi TaxID=933632 RepID=A0ACB8EMU9_9SAUR
MGQNGLICGTFTILCHFAVGIKESRENICDYHSHRANCFIVEDVHGQNQQVIVAFPDHTAWKIHNSWQFDLSILRRELLLFFLIQIESQSVQCLFLSKHSLT